MSTHWNLRQRPVRLEARFEFPDYEHTRDFLDRAAELSELEGTYPDISFGRTYVNITLHADDGAQSVGEPQQRYARLVDELLPGQTAAA